MNDTTPNPDPGAKTVPAPPSQPINPSTNQPISPSVPPVSSGMYGHGSHLLQSGMMLPPQTPGSLGTIGKYQVIKILGEGGMGQVVLAREPVTDSMVAIKLIKPEFLNKSWAVHRFLTEARHMFRMSHGSIIRVLDVSDRAEGPYFVMPFMAGGSLADKIKPGEPLPPETILPVARAVAEALQHAHTRGITHRDLKPSNILLDAEGRAQLADFGLLRTFLNDTLIDTSQPQMEGTVPYMSPAVAAGKAEDTRCDIYAFGCLLYEMLTGQPPYQGPTVDAVLKQIQDGPPPPIRQLNPHAPAALTAIADHAMARELRDRYASMGDVVEELDRVAHGKGSIGTRGRVVAKPKNKNALIAAGGVALIALTAFGISRIPQTPPKHPGLPEDPPPNPVQVMPVNPSPGTVISVNLPGGAAMKFCYCPPGSFLMGSPLNDPDRHENEDQVKVLLSKGFWMAQTECTQRQWVAVMDGNPSDFQGDDLPVERASWNTTKLFITKLNEAKTLPTGWKVALPTEAQWEYACRAGTKTAYSFGDELNVTQANFEKFLGKTRPVASYEANGWGLYDMHGNVWEMCEDWLENKYSGGTDPKGPPSGSWRVSRGGGWCGYSRDCRAADRGYYAPENYRCVGFRLTLSSAPDHTESKPDSTELQDAAATPPPGTVLVEGPFSYTVEDGAVSIVKYTGPGGEVTIDDKINNLPVTSLGSGAFTGCAKLTGVTIPATVTSIEKEAFAGCTSLTTVNFKGNAPGGAADASVFAGNDKATVYYLPGTKGWTDTFGGRPVLFQIQDYNGKVEKGAVTIVRYKGPGGVVLIPDKINGLPVTCISDQAFRITNVTSVTIPDTVMSIGNWAFHACGKLVKVTIGNSVTTIKYAAFAGCSGLTGVSIPASVTSIEDASFSSCGSLMAIVVDPANSAYCSGDDGIVFDRHMTRVVSYPGGKAGSYVIPNSVTSISHTAFAGCSGLSNITVPNSVTSIGPYAFAECTSLTDIAIPSSVTEIGPRAFTGCSGLVNIMLPSSITSIGMEVFNGCTKLNRVTIPSSVTYIEGSSFNGCSALTAFMVDAANLAYSSADGVLFDKKITSLLIYPGGKAGTYVIPGGVTKISPSAFANCTKLTGVRIPDSVTDFEPGMVVGCGKLAAIVVDAANPAYSSSADGVLFNKEKTKLVRCPPGKAGSYVVPDSVTSIEHWAFDNCPYLIDVTIPASVVLICEGGVFSSCPRLTRVMIGEGVRSIGKGAFDFCPSLTSVLFRGDAPSGVADIFYYTGGATVYYQPSTKGWGKEFCGRPTAVWDSKIPFTFTTEKGQITLTNYIGTGGDVVIPDKINGVLVTCIGETAFQKCTTMTSLTVPNGVTSIMGRAFDGCSRLTKVKIPGSVTSMGVFEGGVRNPFVNCTNLAAISVDAANPVLASTPDGILFNKEMTALLAYPGAMPGSYTIPDGVTSVGVGAFEGCAGLTEVRIPSGVTSLGPYSRGTANPFENCLKLTSIVVDQANASYCCDADGVVFSKDKTLLACYPSGKVGAYTIPDGVTRIGESAFDGCPGLTTVTTPASLTNMGYVAFANSGEMAAVFFKGNAPNVDALNVFEGTDNVTIYYLPGTTGWEASFCWRPTAVWEEKAK